MNFKVWTEQKKIEISPKFLEETKSINWLMRVMSNFMAGKRFSRDENLLLGKEYPFVSEAFNSEYQHLLSEVLPAFFAECSFSEEEEKAFMYPSFERMYNRSGNNGKVLEEKFSKVKVTPRYMVTGKVVGTDTTYYGKPDSF